MTGGFEKQKISALVKNVEEMLLTMRRNNFGLKKDFTG